MRRELASTSSFNSISRLLNSAGNHAGCWPFKPIFVRTSLRLLLAACCLCCTLPLNRAGRRRSYTPQSLFVCIYYIYICFKSIPYISAFFYLPPNRKLGPGSHSEVPPLSPRYGSCLAYVAQQLFPQGQQRLYPRKPGTTPKVAGNPPLHKMQTRRTLTGALDDVTNPARSRQPLNSVRSMVGYIVRRLHEVFCFLLSKSSTPVPFEPKQGKP